MLICQVSWNELGILFSFSYRPTLPFSFFSFASHLFQKFFQRFFQKSSPTTCTNISDPEPHHPWQSAREKKLAAYYNSTTTISGVVPPLLECGCTHCFVCIYSRDFFLFKSSSSYLDRSTFPRQTTNWILTYIKLVRYWDYSIQNCSCISVYYTVILLFSILILILR